MILFRRISAAFFILFLLISTNTYSQSNDFNTQEDDLVSLYSKLSAFTSLNYDSAGFYSNKFTNEFETLIENNAGTINYNFRRLVDSNFCKVTTSDDGQFRIYSWDTWTGGTMHIFKTIYQWKSDENIFSKIPDYEEGDAGNFCSKIFTISIGDKLNYLAITNSIFSTRDVRQSVVAFRIEGSILNDTVELFKTNTKSLNTINVDFNFFSVVDRPERPLELITYDDKLKLLYIPLVNKKGKVTEKNIIYELKEDYFTFIGFDKGTR